MYQVIYKKAALKGMRKMPAKIVAKMMASFRSLAEDPERHDLDVKKLSGREGYRLRIGQWRAIYHREDDKLILIVVDAGSRGDIYK